MPHDVFSVDYILDQPDRLPTALIFGSIGMGYIVYGRKQANFMVLLAGVWPLCLSIFHTQCLDVDCYRYWACAPAICDQTLNGTLIGEKGERLTSPNGWEFLPAGDAGITRKVTAKGIFWRVQVQVGRRVISKGIWAPAETITMAKQEVEALRSTEAYTYDIIKAVPFFWGCPLFILYEERYPLAIFIWKQTL